MYAVRRGATTLQAFYLLAVVNGSSTFRHIIPRIPADKLGRLNMFAFAGISTEGVMFCFNEPHTNVGTVVFSVFFSFVSGTIISAGTAAISTRTQNPQNIGTHMGMYIGTAGFTVSIGPPVNGAQVDNSSGFEQVAIFSGIVSLVGDVLMLNRKLVTNRGILGKV